MSLGPGRTRVADLSLRVYTRPLHPDWFRVRAFQRIIRTGWEADLRLIEGGHAILFASGAARVAEVLAPSRDDWPESAAQASLKAERSIQLHPGGGQVVYQSCFSVERADPQIFEHLCTELEFDARPTDLFHRQRADSRLDAASLSRLRIEVSERSLLVHAFHVLPEERAIIRTQSLFEPRPGAR